jgi:hypothetical protein
MELFHKFDLKFLSNGAVYRKIKISKYNNHKFSTYVLVQKNSAECFQTADRRSISTFQKLLKFPKFEIFWQAHASFRWKTWLNIRANGTRFYKTGIDVP